MSIWKCLIKYPISYILSTFECSYSTHLPHTYNSLHRQQTTTTPLPTTSPTYKTDILFLLARNPNNAKYIIIIKSIKKKLPFPHFSNILSDVTFDFPPYRPYDLSLGVRSQRFISHAIHVLNPKVAIQTLQDFPGNKALWFIINWLELSVCV